MKGPRLRIDANQDVVTNAKIVYIADDGTETDISTIVTGIDVSLHVGEVARATLHTLHVHGSYTVPLHEVITKELRPRHRGWRLRLKDATTMGAKARRYIYE